MELQEAKLLLDRYRKTTVATQINRREMLVEAFWVFWKSRPSKEDFCRYAAGLVIFPEVLFEIMKKVM